MRTGRVLKILEKLQNAALTTAELLDILILDRGTHYKRLRGIAIPKRKSRPAWNPEYEARRRVEEERQRFYSILTKLRRQKFIQRAERRRSAQWNITVKGLKHIEELRDAIRRAFPSKSKYASEAKNEWKIIIFDIPEREKNKREWLRSVLNHLGLKMLQKSVWTGKIGIPKDFLEDLHNLHMLDYVEIFAITKSGSIRQIE